MANNRLVFDGLEELRQQLRNLPSELAGEASNIVTGAANGAAAEIKGAYPVRTGRLRDSLVVTRVDKGKYTAGAILKNRAKHSWMFENGTQTRQTAIGANRGSMPPGNVFIPRAIAARRRMYEALKDLLTRKGLTVDGNG